ncbi:porin family protein [Flagellimonas sp.]|uniref:porin family protein n=1 Tax=Flagellimonas sp. TaxID=2058762 RepID=UPI003B52A662
MKKLILFSMTLILPLLTLQAQDVQFGAKAGPNFAILQPDLNDPTTRTALHLGAVAEVSISEKLSIQPELLFSAQGTKDESDDDEIVRLDYLTLPILAKFYVAENLSIEAGPQIGILLKAEVEDNGETTDLKDITKSTDLGIAFGMGYKLDNGLNFGARYILGSDVNDLDEDPDKFANRVFQLFVGYFFD